VRIVIFFYDDRDKEKKCILWKDIEKSNGNLIEAIDFFRQNITAWRNSRIISVEKIKSPIREANAFKATFLKDKEIKEIYIVINNLIKPTYH